MSIYEARTSMTDSSDLKKIKMIFEKDVKFPCLQNEHQEQLYSLQSERTGNILQFDFWPQDCLLSGSSGYNTPEFKNFRVYTRV